jgi:hypothetical protein
MIAINAYKLKSMFAGFCSVGFICHCHKLTGTGRPTPSVQLEVGSWQRLYLQLDAFDVLAKPETNVVITSTVNTTNKYNHTG